MAQQDQRLVPVLVDQHLVEEALELPKSPVQGLAGDAVGITHHEGHLVLAEQASVPGKGDVLEQQAILHFKDGSNLVPKIDQNLFSKIYQNLFPKLNQNIFP